MLKIYNSLTSRKEEFVPITPGKIRLYVCGITAYDYCHLGHARFLVVFDVIVRFLRSQGFKVTYVRNITDVDDKIIKRAREAGIEASALTEKFIAAMDEDCDALGLDKPDEEPRATVHMDEIIAMIEKLVDNGHAYVADNGDVYFDVSSYEAYGRLSHKKMDELRVGARIAVDEAKQDALDFALWKAAKPEEPSWDSPWGAGRPGWHIECSAMSTHCLGDHFDIHGGGMDLKFPHHENEIAQSVCATGKPFVNYWMHNGFVQVGDEKMSKSLGNFQTVRDLLEHYRPEAIRYFILSSHYRSPLSYGAGQLDAANTALTRLYTALRDLEPAEAPAEHPAREAFEAAMNDDINTPVALSVLFDLVHEINSVKSEQPEVAAGLAGLLMELANHLGLLRSVPSAWLQSDDDSGPSAEDIEALIEQRAQAKAGKDYATADRIRDELQEAGVRLEDGPDGTQWTRVG